MPPPNPHSVTRSAARFAALGAEPRLEILRLLLSAHPRGMVVGQIQDELGVPASTLSHHLEKLKIVGLVTVRRDRQFLWYAANTEALRELLGFLYEECCTRSRVVSPESLVQLARQS
jgi:ArsR family transcriptional regulator